MKVTSCEVMQYLKNGADLNKWIEICENRKTIKKACAIIHDKDVKEDGSLKDSHIHLYLSFGSNMLDINDIASWFGVLPQYVEKIKNGFKNALAYATHKNAPSKYQYNVDSLYLKNIDYQQETQLKTKSKINQYIIDFRNGLIDYNQLLNSLSSEEQLLNDSYIKKACSYLMEDLEKKLTRNMQVFYITGLGGSGKTTLAKMLANNFGYEPYITQGEKDLFQGYKFQKSIIIDDFRASNLKFNEFLRLTDNNTNTSVSSRYYNKNIGLCEYMFITSIDNPLKLYWEFQKNENIKECAYQLFRRLQCIEIIDNDIYFVKYLETFKGSNIYEPQYKKFDLYDMSFVFKKMGVTDKFDSNDFTNRNNILMASFDISDLE